MSSFSNTTNLIKYFINYNYNDFIERINNTNSISELNKIKNEILSQIKNLDFNINKILKIKNDLNNDIQTLEKIKKELYKSIEKLEKKYKNIEILENKVKKLHAKQYLESLTDNCIDLDKILESTELNVIHLEIKISEFLALKPILELILKLSEKDIYRDVFSEEIYDKFSDLVLLQRHYFIKGSVSNQAISKLVAILFTKLLNIKISPVNIVVISNPNILIDEKKFQTLISVEQAIENGIKNNNFQVCQREIKSLLIEIFTPFYKTDNKNKNDISNFLNEKIQLQNKAMQNNDKKNNNNNGKNSN